MQNATGEFAHTSRIKLLDDTDGDGRMDKATIFVDSLYCPVRFFVSAISCSYRKPIYSISAAISDTNGDGKADVQKVVFRNDVRNVRNLEHQNGALMWNMDNWIYPSRDNLRYKYKNGMLTADTMVDNMIGQWGLTSDNYGRLFYTEAGPGLPAVQIQQMPAYGALNFQDQYSEEFTQPWPIIGTFGCPGWKKRLAAGRQHAKQIYCRCGQSIFRGDRLPADMLGDYFIPEPVGRIVKRGDVNKQGRENIYPGCVQAARLAGICRHEFSPGQYLYRARWLFLYCGYVSWYYPGERVDRTRVLPG
jgi:hypothetical protein